MSLQKIQSELKAPKGQFNSFGKYNYRSQEDILEALKPVLARHECSLVISDTIEQIGSRYYIKATANLYGPDMAVIATSTSYAREPESRKGMDEAQVTGSSSSYARKYCLNALFLIDDTKDPDSTNNGREPSSRIAESQVADIESLMSEVNGNPAAFCKYFKISSVHELPSNEFNRAVAMLEAKRGK